MNPYMKLKRLEFPVTFRCTGSCKHCSNGTVRPEAHINTQRAVSVVRELCGQHALESVMTFGGEPLLYSKTVCEIHKTAKDCGVPLRQVITNGFFTTDEAKMRDTAFRLADAGVNSLLLSVDCFHQETIPVEAVYSFAEAVIKAGIPGVQLQPAWVVNRSHQNPYNQATEDYLDCFSNLGISVSDGNAIFPAGNAVVYLSEYYPKRPFDLEYQCGDAPYTEKLDGVSCLSISPDGDVMVCCFVIGNIYHEKILDIVKRYQPNHNPAMAALLNDGVGGLVRYGSSLGIEAEPDNCYSPCDVCRKIVRKLKA